MSMFYYNYLIDKIKKVIHKIRNWLFYKSDMKEARFFNKQEIPWCSVCNDRHIPGLKVLLYSVKQYNPDIFIILK